MNVNLVHSSVKKCEDGGKHSDLEGLGGVAAAMASPKSEVDNFEKTVTEEEPETNGTQAGGGGGGVGGGGQQAAEGAPGRRVSSAQAKFATASTPFMDERELMEEFVPDFQRVSITGDDCTGVRHRLHNMDHSTTSCPMV